MTDRRPGVARHGPADTLRRLRATGDDRPPFVEGLILGAMVGAAIAGSTIWSRLRSGRPDEGMAGPGTRGGGEDPGRRPGDPD